MRGHLNTAIFLALFEDLSSQTESRTDNPDLKEPQPERGKVDALTAELPDADHPPLVWAR